MRIGYDDRQRFPTIHGWRHKLNGDLRTMCGIEAPVDRVIETVDGRRCGSRACQSYFQMVEEMNHAE